MGNKHNNRNKLHYSMIDKILEVNDALLNQGLEDHSKLFVMRLDIRFPRGTDQRKISTFNQRFVEKEKYRKYDPKYIAVREISSQGNVHYHIGLLLNGNITDGTHVHFENAKIVLQNIIGSGHSVCGLIDKCNHGYKNGIMLSRKDINAGDTTALEEVRRQLSYLAKKDQKQDVKGKRFFTSIRRRKKRS